MDDMGLDTALPEPARQLEPVATGFEGQHDPPDRPSCLHPSSRQRSSSLRSADGSGSSFFCGCAQARETIAPTEPTRLAQLDSRDQGCILLKGDEGTAQVIDLGRHGTSPSV
jgi:hypothetical protein